MCCTNHTDHRDHRDHRDGLFLPVFPDQEHKTLAIKALGTGYSVSKDVVSQYVPDMLNPV